MGVLLLIAGHETSANMIALGTLALLEHPDQLALLRDTDNPKLVASAVEELLRYVIPNDIGNRDTAAFADPDRLDVRRAARHYVAFGFGVHQCLGQSLAQMELQVVYSTLNRRVPTLRLALDLEQIPFKHDESVYRVYELP